jgi:hypothetical protein
MSCSVSRHGLWAFLGFLLLMTLATGRGDLGIAVVIAATVLIELLSWLGPFGLGNADRDEARRGAQRSPDRPGAAAQR